jgi:anti-anti-sigma factor
MTGPVGSLPQETIRLEQVGDVLVVRFIDDKISDATQVEKLGRELIALSESCDAPRIVIDFSNVRFFSSLAINKLIVLEKRVRAKGGKIRLSELAPALREVFGFSQLDRLFTIHDLRTDAISELSDAKTK